VTALIDPEGTFPSPLARRSRAIHPSARRVARIVGRFRRTTTLRQTGPLGRGGDGLVAVGLVLAIAALAASGPGCRRDDASSAARPAAGASNAGSAAAPASASATGSSASPGSAAAPAPTGSAPRLISLTPSATEIVAALGATSLLIGVDDYSTYPPEVARLPRVGSFLAPNLETIVGLRPSLVIVDDVHGQVAGALNDAGIATVACAVHALPDVKAALRAVGDRIGKPADADRVIAAIETALDRAAAQRPAKRPRVLAVIDREAGGLGNLVTAGPGSWIDELLAVVGGDNVLSAAGARYPKISAEEVLRARPEVILDLSYAARDSIAAWDRLAVPAVAAHRVRAITDPFLLAPSPRVGEALAALAGAIDR
jgi:iron complex transport system substrate-binding protein